MTRDNETINFMGVEIPEDRMTDAIALRAKLNDLLEQFVVDMETSMRSIEELINADDELTKLVLKLILDWRQNNIIRIQSAIKTISEKPKKKKVPRKVNTGVSETEKAIGIHMDIKAQYYEEDKVLDWRHNQDYYRLYMSCCELLYESLRDELIKLEAENNEATVDVAIGNIQIDIHQYAQAVKDEWLDEETDLPFGDDDDLQGSIIATLVDDHWMLSACEKTNRPVLLPYAKGLPSFKEGADEHNVIRNFKTNPNDRAKQLDGLRNLNVEKA